MLIQLRMGAYSVEDGCLYIRRALVQSRLGAYSVEDGSLYIRRALVQSRPWRLFS